MMRRHQEAKGEARAPTQRQLRVGEEIRHALAAIFRQDGLRDPALVDLNVTVSEVRVSPDLKNATAFVMPLGGDHPERIDALNKASTFLRGQLARAVRLPHIPRLVFTLDTSFDYAQRIDRLLQQATAPRAQPAPKPPDIDIPDADR
jgi:ribosome-binding factor A